jgi:hypothetical protein
MSYGTKNQVRLKLEELEPRALLAALTGGSPDVTGNGALSGGGFPIDAAAVAANAIGSAIGNVNFPAGAINPADLGFASANFVNQAPTPGAAVSTGFGASSPGGANSNALDATTGVGQITISTGANTPGMGSFATSTLGFASENGGRSGG